MKNQSKDGCHLFHIIDAHLTVVLWNAIIGIIFVVTGTKKDAIMVSLGRNARE